MGKAFNKSSTDFQNEDSQLTRKGKRTYSTRLRALYVEALIPSETTFGDRAFHKVLKGVIKVKWDHKGGILVQYDWCPYKERKRKQGCLHTGKSHVRTQQEGSPLQVKEREATGENHPAGTMTLDLQASGLWEINFCCLNHLVWGALLWQPKNTNTNDESKSKIINDMKKGKRQRKDETDTFTYKAEHTGDVRNSDAYSDTMWHKCY